MQRSRLSNNFPPIGGFFTFVLYYLYMSTSFPDGISFGELDALRDQAPKENEVKEEKALFDGKTQEQVCEIATALCHEAIEKCNDPIMHKAMMIEMIENMIRWHTEQGIGQDDDRSTVCWLRDAGKFQAIANILTSISVGPHDFILD